MDDVFDIQVTGELKEKETKKTRKTWGSKRIFRIKKYICRYVFHRVKISRVKLTICLPIVCSMNS